jgi:hypothetical protein
MYQWQGAELQIRRPEGSDKGVGSLPNDHFGYQPSQNNSNIVKVSRASIALFTHQMQPAIASFSQTNQPWYHILHTLTIMPSKTPVPTKAPSDLQLQARLNTLPLPPNTPPRTPIRQHQTPPRPAFTNFNNSLPHTSIPPFPSARSTFPTRIPILLSA